MFICYYVNLQEKQGPFHFYSCHYFILFQCMPENKGPVNVTQHC